MLTYELIANTPVEDGVTKVWHGALTRAQNVPHTEADIAAARTVQAGALQAFFGGFRGLAQQAPGHSHHAVAQGRPVPHHAPVVRPVL